MASKQVCIRVSDAEFSRLKAQAEAVGASLSEVVRALIKSAGGHQSADVIEGGIALILDRLEGQEGGHNEPAPSSELVPIFERIDALSRAQQRHDEGLAAIVQTLERMMAAPRYEPVPAAQTEPKTLASGKQPAPLGGFGVWVAKQPHISETETKGERAQRLIPVYNAQFDPPYVPPGGA